ncbi:MAG: peptidase M3 [Halobacteriovorax sp.]|nr:peptidase M3 [Halobacteriovorax sp.]|tara:strand:- start:209715 stop:211745 length:2031 start_codon:yes stop_codon:yes gene_type:complete
MNPFLEKFNTPHETMPFDKIENEHFMPALEAGIEEDRKEIEAIKNNPEEPSFENVIEALDRTGDLLGKVTGVFFNLHSANTNDELQDIAKEFSPKLTEYGNEILLDEVLFEKIKAVYDKRNELGLDVDQMTLVEKFYNRRAQNGALLKGEKKEKLIQINKDLSKLSLEFGDHLLKETNSYELVLENKEDLDGLPDSAIEAAAMIAKEKGKEGKWVITLDFPSFGPFMKYSNRRDLRETVYKAYTSRANKGNDCDNNEIIKKIAKLRHEKAQLLGYDSHAHLTLQERMAAKPETVTGFLNTLLEKAKPVAEKEIDGLKEYIVKNGGPADVQAWDLSYWSEKLKKEKYDINDELLKPYFKLENVVEGVFKVAEKLYGLTFKENKDIPSYHEDVRTFEVFDGAGNFTSVFYADFFPRAGKRNGAWMTSYKDQFVRDGQDSRPHISIVCNFTKPTETKPSLLTFNEVLTLFHEFGHALHGMLSKGRYESLSGTSVYWDFVELPSQILENWAFEKECLDLFATHYETGEKIPQEYIQKIKDSSNFHEGSATLRQLSFAKLDMAWHSKDPSDISNVEDFEEKITEPTRLVPKVPGSASSCAFGHIFQGGYSAGYYSYKWAEVLDADAFEAFKEKGIFNKDVADKFRTEILEKGGSEHPMELYKRFRGKEPTPDALLKRGGLA